MLLPDPVGATDRTSRPASIAATTSDCPGLNASSPKTSLRARSAFSIITPECDGIPRRYHRPLTGPITTPRIARSLRNALVPLQRYLQNPGAPSLDVRNPPTSGTFDRYAEDASPAAADRSWRTRSVDCGNPCGRAHLRRERGAGGRARLRTGW